MPAAPQGSGRAAVPEGVLRRSPIWLPVALSLFVAGSARADEPWLLSVEGSGVAPVGDPQSGMFGPGGAAAVAIHRPLGSVLLPGLRLRGGLLSDAGAPDDPGRVDPGAGGFASLALALRVRPFGGSDDVRRGTGPFVEVAAGPALTGSLWRAGVEAGLGWGFELGPVDVAPTLRYLQIVEPDQSLDGRDARLVLAGVEVVLFDARPTPAPPPPPPPVAPPGDRDGDGIVDPDDHCPDDPEDRDGFEDADGCPDRDNDGDRIPDDEDSCPNDPEDRDGFEDTDGCPDHDNDGDGIVDVDDACPNEPEVVNGIDDQDGCPDRGLIEFVNDRIVLDDRVLFAYDRAFIRPRAGDVLDAIITLWRQHPEWERVRIEGHTDIRGTPRYNQQLSERRAQTVMEALIERGMPRGMIESIGHGETRPLNLGSREATHRRNRRVEFVVISRRALVDGQPVEPTTEVLDVRVPREEGER